MPPTWPPLIRGHPDNAIDSRQLARVRSFFVLTELLFWWSCTARAAVIDSLLDRVFISRFQSMGPASWLGIFPARAKILCYYLALFPLTEICVRFCKTRSRAGSGLPERTERFTSDFLYRELNTPQFPREP